MACQHYPGLAQRVHDLTEQFLAAQIMLERDSPLEYTPNTRQIAAFRLLVHAELEDYLETKAKDGISLIERHLLTGRLAVRDNFHLLVVARAIDSKLRFDLRTWEKQALQVVHDARIWIASNNGIKEDAFFMLSIFSGKMPDEVDAGLSASLSSYGTGRGDVAHKATHRVATLHSPSTEAKNVVDILAALNTYFD